MPQAGGEAVPADQRTRMAVAKAAAVVAQQALWELPGVEVVSIVPRDAAPSGRVLASQSHSPGAVAPA